MSTHIDRIAAAVVPDSRQRPTISVTVEAGEWSGTFSVPSGASTGEREVTALPAATAVQVVEERLASKLVGLPVTDQVALDAALRELDGTDTFSTIGGNTALGISVAVLKAAAASQGQAVWEYIATLFSESPQSAAPRLFVNLINGGAHATCGSQIQEHQVIPETDNVHEAFRVASAIQRALYDSLLEDFTEAEIGIGDEGGFMVPTNTLDAPFAYLEAAIAAAESPCPVSLGTDVAASSFVVPGGYQLDGVQLTSEALVARLSELRTKFERLTYVEDPAGEQDLDGFAAFQARHPEAIVIGDDLTTTRYSSLATAIAARAVSGIIIKPNQIGTVSDTLTTMRLAYQHNVRCIVSHRSGETMDDFIADLAYGTKAFGLKAGAPTAKERLVKYQRLLEICS